MVDEVTTGPWLGFNRAGSDNLYDSNKFTAYEIKLWTPVVVGSTAAGTATYSLQGGIIVFTGPLAFVSAQLTWTGHTGTGDLTVTGLPTTIQPYIRGTPGDPTYDTGAYLGTVYTINHAGVAIRDGINAYMSYTAATAPTVLFIDNTGSFINMDAAATLRFSLTYVRAGFLN